MKDKNPIMAYVLFAVAVIAIFLFYAGIIPESIMLFVVGITGFSGVAAVRNYIESQGWKTYFVAAMGILGVLAQVFFPNIVSPDELANWLAFWGIIGAGTLTHAIQKTNKSG